MLLGLFPEPIQNWALGALLTFLVAREGRNLYVWIKTDKGRLWEELQDALKWARSQKQKSTWDSLEAALEFLDRTRLQDYAQEIIAEIRKSKTIDKISALYRMHDDTHPDTNMERWKIDPALRVALLRAASVADLLGDMRKTLNDNREVMKALQDLVRVGHQVDQEMLALLRRLHP